MSDTQTKRPEKLSSAIYLVTSFFIDLEPLKWRLRTLASELVSHNIGQNSGAVRQTVLELNSLFSIAKNAGLVSDANYSILTRELESYLGTLPAPEIGDKFFFQVPREERLEAPKQEIKVQVKDEVIKDKTDSFGAVSVKKNSRKSVIIGLLRRKKEIMIKDVTPLIPGVSEKTIQRELLAMVAEGVLKKVGEKRWTKYTLVSA